MQSEHNKTARKIISSELFFCVIAVVDLLKQQIDTEGLTE